MIRHSKMLMITTWSGHPLRVFSVAQTLLLFFSFVSLSLAAQPAGYYSGAESLKGAALKQRLHEIIRDHTTYPYTSSATDVWDVLKEADRDRENPENVLLFYTGWSLSGEEEYRRGSGWTREHVWAKSHGEFGTDRGAGTDLHALRPADVTVNSARNNKDFDEGGELYVDGDGFTRNRTDSDSWEPRDEVKGDVARSLFYMATRYEGEGEEPDLELVDTVHTVSLNEPGKGFHGKLSTLLRWHKEDPVDEYEWRRHETVYEYQGNRNPFIDRPEYVALIWDSLRTSTVTAQYYEPASGLKGMALRAVLYELVRDHAEYSYTASSTDVWDILKSSDALLDSADRVELFYSGWSALASKEFDRGQGWSREHIWDQEHGDFGTSRGAGTDVHAIRPVDISVGRTRGALDFDEGGNVYFDTEGPCTCRVDFDSFQPRPSKKGDVARMMFYMDLRYEGEGDEPQLVLVDTINTLEFSNDSIGYHGKLSTLIKWHLEDPVDEPERRRHEKIFEYQQNRNPFIDHPEYVFALWDTSNLGQYMPPIDTLTATNNIRALTPGQWKLYPNPASRQVFMAFDLPSSEKQLILTIRDLQGRQVIRQEGSPEELTVLDISRLQAAIYLISLETSWQHGTQKLIVLPGT